MYIFWVSYFCFMTFIHKLLNYFASPNGLMTSAWRSEKCVYISKFLSGVKVHICYICIYNMQQMAFSFTSPVSVSSPLWLWMGQVWCRRLPLHREIKANRVGPASSIILHMSSQMPICSLQSTWMLAWVCGKVLMSKPSESTHIAYGDICPPICIS